MVALVDVWLPEGRTLVTAGAVTSTEKLPEPVPVVPALSLTLTAMVWLPAARPEAGQLIVAAVAVQPVSAVALPSRYTWAVAELMPLVASE